jgi:hypothetical protein
MQPKIVVAFVAGGLLVGAAALLNSNMVEQLDLKAPSGVSEAGGAPSPVAKVSTPPRSARTLTIAEGTVLKAALQSNLASHESRTGDQFTLTVTEPILLDGRVAIPRGASVHGVVVGARPSGKIDGRGELTLDFRSVTDVNGRTHRIDARTFHAEAEGVGDRDAAMIAGGGAGGAIIGGLVGGRKGALIGGLVGAAAGTGTVLATKGPEVRLTQGSVFAITLTAPLTVPAGTRVSS